MQSYRKMLKNQKFLTPIPAFPSARLLNSIQPIDRGFGQGGCDFLKSTEPLARNIITNPPNGTHGL